MTYLRESLLRLPYVTPKEDGTLNTWDVRPSGNFEYDRRIGRAFAAGLLYILRDLDTPGVTYHICRGWAGARDDAPARGGIRQGFTDRYEEAVRAAPEGSSLSDGLASGVTFDGRDLRGAMLSLPFLREAFPGGGLSAVIPESKGDYSQDNATGRYYGALLVKFIRDTGYPGLLAQFSRSIRGGPLNRVVNTGLLVGLNHVVTESAMGGSDFEAATRPRSPRAQKYAPIAFAPV